MHYEINISRGGKHVFATNPRSCTSGYDLEKLVPLLAEKFPSSDGYKMTVSRVKQVSNELNAEEISQLRKPYHA